ncbi:MFS transporter [Paenibacillus turpanensis]|uniref:MFS transporter n=1 Tax=Paenibacillus turpanensis TaxID=2689078 RepID=UPI00140744AE|nr:MFS transporter [Paenibacillus turpanensis]
MLRIFKNTSFSLFVGSRTIANIADSVYFMAILWLVQTASGSVAFTGLAYSAMSVALLFSFAFGPIIDRYSPALLAGIALLVQSVIIAAIPFLGVAGNQVPLLLALLFIAALFSALYYPAINTLLPRILRGKEDLFAGNSIIGSTDEIINLAGFLAGGSIIVAFGVNQTLFLSAAMLLAACAAYFILTKRLAATPAPGLEEADLEQGERLPANFKTYLSELKEGMQFVLNNDFLRLVLPLSAISNLGMAIVIIVIPSVGESFGSAFYFSLLYVASFVGMIIGALLSNALPKNGLVMSAFWIGEGIALILFVLLPHQFVWKLVAVILFGICSGLNTVLLTSFVQLMTKEHLLGRVMSAVSTLASISLPLGGLLGGLLSFWLSVDWIMIISSALIVSSGLFLLFKEQIRSYTVDEPVQAKEVSV